MCSMVRFVVGKKCCHSVTSKVGHWAEGFAVGWQFVFWEISSWVFVLLLYSNYHPGESSTEPTCIRRIIPSQSTGNGWSENWCRCWKQTSARRTIDIGTYIGTYVMVLTYQKLTWLHMAHSTCSDIVQECRWVCSEISFDQVMSLFCDVREFLAV